MLRVVHQLVVGRAQQRVAGVLAPARAVDHALRVLDAHADRERLGHHVHAVAVQHAEAVARAVAQRQHHVAGGQFLNVAGLEVFDRQRPNGGRRKLLIQ